MATIFFVTQIHVPGIYHPDASVECTDEFPTFAEAQASAQLCMLSDHTLECCEVGRFVDAPLWGLARLVMCEWTVEFIHDTGVLTCESMIHSEKRREAREKYTAPNLIDDLLQEEEIIAHHDDAHKDRGEGPDANDDVITIDDCI